MNTHVKRAIVAHVASVPTEEVCGLIVQDEQGVIAFPCSNVSPEARNESFEIDPQEYIRAAGMGRICGIYHGGATHTNDTFSEEDIAMAREMCLPLHLVSAAGKWSVFVPPTYHVDPVGQIFCWGIADCYEAVRTHFRQTRNIYMTDYDRDESIETATDPVISPFITAEGFALVPQHEPILRDDVLLFRMPGQRHPQHLAVVTGPNQMLHHRARQLSVTEAIDGVWLRRLAGVCRYIDKAA